MSCELNSCELDVGWGLFEETKEERKMKENVV